MLWWIGTKLACDDIWGLGNPYVESIPNIKQKIILLKSALCSGHSLELKISSVA